MRDQDIDRTVATDPSEPNDDRVFSERELAKENDAASQPAGEVEDKTEDANL